MLSVCPAGVKASDLAAGAAVENIGYTPLNKATDTATGPLNVTLSSAPIFQSLQQAIAEIGKLYAYGFVGGNSYSASHPLSSITSFNGANSTGWTLAQWQIVLPAATALTNEADEVAIQSAINAATGPTSITLPAGIARLTKPIKSGRYPISVHCAVVNTCVVLQTVAVQDGWHHGTSDTGYSSVYGSTVNLSGVQFQCGPNGVSGSNFICGTAIVANENQSSGGFTLTDVTISGAGNQTYNFWHDGVRCTGCGFTFLTRTTLIGTNSGALAKIGTALNFDVTSGKAYQFLFRDTTANFWTTALAAQSGDNDLEGFVLHNFQASKDLNGIVVTGVNTSGTNFLSPQWVIADCQFNIYKQAISFNQVSEYVVADSLFYSSSPDAYSGSFTASPFVSFTDVGDGQFKGNNFELGTGNNLSTVVSITSATGLAIADNVIKDFGTSLVFGLYNVSGNTYVTEKNTKFLSWRSIPKVAGATNGGLTNRFETFYAGLGASLSGSGIVSYAGTATGTLTSALELAIVFPSSSMYLSAPTVSAVNGDLGSATTTACGVKASTVTTSGFTAKCPGGTSGAAVRINYTATGT